MQEQSILYGQLKTDSNISKIVCHGHVNWNNHENEASPKPCPLAECHSSLRRPRVLREDNLDISAEKAQNRGATKCEDMSTTNASHIWESYHAA